MMKSTPHDVLMQNLAYDVGDGVLGSGIHVPPIVGDGVAILASKTIETLARQISLAEHNFYRNSLDWIYSDGSINNDSWVYNGGQDIYVLIDQATYTCEGQESTILTSTSSICTV